MSPSVDQANVLDTVAIVGGTGALGTGLAIRWTMAGVPVVIGSRRLEAAVEAARRVAQVATAGGANAPDIGAQVNTEAVRMSRMVFLTVPLAAHAETLRSIHSATQPDTVLVDATATLATALGGKPTRTIALWQGSAAQQAAESAGRGVTVVSALHTVSAASLADPTTALDEDVLVSGDDAGAKRRAAGFIERIAGLRAIDCGDLETARITEQLVALLISINRRYKSHAGIRITGLPAERW